MKFSFIIPAYNNWQLVHQLLFDIYKNCSTPHEILLMDNGSMEPGFLDGVAWWSSTGLLPITHIRNTEDMGFLKNSNKGLKLATGDKICLVSTDVRIHKDVVGYWADNNSLLGGRLLDFDTGWNTFRGKIYPYVEGWILTTTKDNWNKIGYFDERFSPNDMEDVDASTMAIEFGMRLEIYPEGYVSHIGAQTIGYSPEREAITHINKKKFEKKWVKNVD